MEKWRYIHQFILKNNPDYTEIIQNDLCNYYEANCPTIYIEKSNEIIYKVGQKTIRIKKLNKNISKTGALIIDTAFSSEKRERIDITTDDKTTIIIHRNEKLSQIFLENILIEIE